MPVRRPALVASALGLFAIAGSAAALPEIVDRVPSSAMLAVGVPSLENLEKDFGALGALIGAPVPGLDQLFAMAGLPGGGIAKNGSAAIIVMAPGANGEPPKVLALVPASDYKTLVGNFGVTPSGQTDEAQIEGNAVFFKPLQGNFVVVGDDKAVIDAFTGAGGNGAAYKTLVGAEGDALASRSDLFIIVNMPVARPMLQARLTEAMDNAMAQMPGAEAAPVETINFLRDAALQDTRAAVMGLSIDNFGVGLDMALAFNEGSRFAKITSGKGAASGLTARLPSLPYLLALAADFSSPELAAFLGEIPLPAGEAADSFRTQIESLKKLKGAAFLMGQSPAGPMAGLFNQAVSYQASANPAGVLSDFRASMQKAQDAKTASTKYAQGAADVAGQKVDTYEMRMIPSGDPSAAQAMMMMFGASGGPSGYIATLDDALVTTFSRSTPLMQSALAAAKNGGGLGADKLLAQVGEKMPADRVAEVYLSVHGVLTSVMPMFAMMFGPINVEIPENLPPVGLALAPRGGSLAASIYIPTPVIKTVAQTAQAFQAAQQGGEEAPMQDEPAKEGAGQPRF